MKHLKTIMLFVLVALSATAMFAQAEPAAAATVHTGVQWGLISAAFVLGLAAFGGALGQGKAIAAACEGIARNPGAAGAIRLAMIIGLALIESLVIYALVIAFIVQAK
ncbi:MAG: ATP synthase F0 subunit C [Thermoanaerobaculia bacterium]